MSIFTANFNIFLHQLGACAFFRGFYEVRTLQLNSYSKNSKFYRGLTSPLINLPKRPPKLRNSCQNYEIWRKTNFCRTIFCEIPLSFWKHLKKLLMLTLQNCLWGHWKTLSVVNLEIKLTTAYCCRVLLEIQIFLTVLCNRIPLSLNWQRNTVTEYC